MTLISSVLLHFAALLLGALGAMTAGWSGALCFALEGIMLSGGLAGAMTSHLPWALSLLTAGAAGTVCALMLGLAVCRGANPLFGGVAMNGFMAALSMIIARLAGGISYSRKTYQLLIGGENVTVFLPAALLLLLAMWLLIFHTRWGLRLRLCGRNGEAAWKAGVRLGGMRILAWAVCGFLGGIGGLAAMISLGGGWRMEWGVGGMGYAAPAALLLGHWRPFRVMLSAALFALAAAGAEAAAAAWLAVPEGVFRLLPFLLALIVLALVGKKDGAPEETAKTERLE